MSPRRALGASALTMTLFATLGCGSGDDATPHPQPALTPVASEPVGDCSAVVRDYGRPTGLHLPECSNIIYASSPPVFGDHYPTWAAYQTYDFPVPLGYLVHDLEHGAVVIFYDCPDGCSDEVATAQALIDDLPADPRCSDAVRVQVVLVPRPGLGARWAASSWGYSLTADCFDADAFRQFYTEHVGHGSEDLCTQGTVLTSDRCQ